MGNLQCNILTINQPLSHIRQLEKNEYEKYKHSGTSIVVPNVIFLIDTNIYIQSVTEHFSKLSSIVDGLAGASRGAEHVVKKSHSY
jgi:hypothetical protein